MDNVVIGMNTHVNKSILEENVITAGNPVKIIKRDTVWGRKMYNLTMNDDKTISTFVDKYHKTSNNKDRTCQ